MHDNYYMTTTAVCSYRKTKNGSWAVMGPADLVRANRTVQVTKKDGSTKMEMIESVGKTFQVNGQTMVYGYLGERTETRNHGYSGRKSCVSGGDCSSFGSGRSCGGRDCDGY